MKILVINGPNLNMLGVRERELYGEKSYAALVKRIKADAKRLKIKVKCVQSNYEGALVGAVQKAWGRYDGIVINAGGYTHTSVAILDALKAVSLPTVEVHLTDIDHREEFRQRSFVSLYAEKVIKGKGFDGYTEGLIFLAEKIGQKK